MSPRRCFSRYRLFRFLAPVVLTLTGSVEMLSAPLPRPNIVIILADDMGFSDLGCFGGEIHTPQLDKLACDSLNSTTQPAAARRAPPSLPGFTRTRPVSDT